VPDEPHSASNPLSGISLVGGSALPFLGDRTLDRLARDSDLVCNVNELFKSEALIGRVLNEIIETRCEVDDLPDLIAREPPLLALYIHNRKCTQRGRSVPGQIDTKTVRVEEHN
jgi:hypothetical protein